MVRKILLLAAVFGATSLHAQSSDLIATAKLWNKNDSKSKNSDQRSLNGYTQLSAANFDKQSVLNPFQSNEATIYVVFKSNDAEPVDLINYKFRCYETVLNSFIKDANIQDEAVIRKKVQTGAIFKHEFHLPFDENNLEANTFFINDIPTDKTDLYEIFYFDKSFTPEDHKSVQTYLSLKYGITLINIDNYVDANGNVIWNSSLNPKTNHHIVGVGRNDKAGLYHTKTTNSLDPFLTIQTKEPLKDNSYVLMADSNESLAFSDGLLNRKWLVQSTNNNQITTDLIFDSRKIENFDASKNYILVISNDVNIDIHGFDNASVLPKIQDGKLIFENLKWDGIQSFTLLAGEAQKVEGKVELAERFLLRNKYVTLEPSVYNPSNERLTYQWIMDNEVVGSEQKLNTGKEGLYTLTVKSQDGSSKSYQTHVIRLSDTTSDFNVYPNPVVSNEKFTIRLEFSEASDVELSIFQSNGKYLMGKSEKGIQNFVFENTLLSSGTYLVVAVVNGKSFVKKLVVK